jgi:pimeloyl-ACP methyl ester carboxylesterase
VCAYSRPTLIRDGVGPRAGSSPAQLVQTLRDVLSALSEAPPYVMVGHSYGGMIIRLYATTYPVDVSGMVLIDSSHEDQIARFDAIDPEVGKQLRAPSRSEALDLVAVSAALNDRRWHGDIPLVVLTHGVTPKPQPGRETQTNGLEQAWLELQRDLASRSPHSAHTIAAKSGHYIQRDEPALVIDAVRRVVAGRP